jgi:uncharacterized protein YrrD
MDCEYLSQAFNGKPVVSLEDGQIIGKVVDAYVDPTTLRIAAVITSRGGMLRRELTGFLSSEVQLWGQDTVLVKRSGIIQKGEALTLDDSWLRVSDQVKGHDVVDSTGTRIGRINDVVINCDGCVVGYNLSEIHADSPAVVGGRIAVQYSHSLGADVLIVETTAGG